ncbi:MAG: alanine--glyoxylate aminotransferase family protein, partial [Polaromonas sp.]|nr:alanine--glyoxylate aminotransferase family protein [Polaromonas sp.]
FRVGLFGLDKWHQSDRTVSQLAAALDEIGLTEKARQPVAA